MLAILTDVIIEGALNRYVHTVLSLGVAFSFITCTEHVFIYVYTLVILSVGWSMPVLMLL